MSYTAIAVVTFVAAVVCSSPVNVILFEIGLGGNRTATSYLNVAPAFSLAEQQLNARYGENMKFMHVHKYDKNISVCVLDEKKGVMGLDTKATFWTTKFYYRERLSNDTVMAIFGPGCSISGNSVASLAKAWDKPLIFGVPGSALAFNKTRYPTLTRLSPYTPENLISFLLKLLGKYQYNSIGVLCDASNDHLSLFLPLCLELKNPDKPILTKNNINASHYLVNSDEKRNLSDYLGQLRLVTRVIFIVAESKRFRQIMLMASEKNMTNGEYVYFALEVYRSPTFFGNSSWNTGNTDGRDEEAKEAYKSMFILSLRDHASDKTTQQLLVNISSSEPYTLNGSRPNQRETANPFALGFYEALMIYGQVLNETYASGGNLSAGEQISHKMWNRTFNLEGKRIVMNANGDRESDYSIAQMDYSTGQFQPVLEYRAYTQRIDPVLTSEGKEREIKWYNRDSPPPNRPRCGYLGNDAVCVREQNIILAASVVSAVIFVGIVSVIALLVYRKRKLEAAINDPWWRVPPEEISAKSDRHGLSVSISRLSLGNMSVADGASSAGGHSQVFAKTAQYKNKVVCVKKLQTSRRFHATRKELKEIKKLHDINNDNMNPLVGIAVEDAQVQVLFEYCQKGSLADVLENEAIKLDWSFRYSLIGDIVSGLAYLHDSPIKSHGNLTSSNCVIDNRFVLKITDYGLGFLQPFLNKNVELAKTDEGRLLWRAPEHLRAQMPPQGTPEGDVYSFAIILQEIVLRCHPYGSPDPARLPMEPYAIVAQVAKGTDPPLRPHVSGDACPPELRSIMEHSWSEAPEARPTLKDIKGQLKKIPGAEQGNLMDNLMKRMEAYATDLEGLVMLRTEQVYQEKQKSENLLFEVLPRSVANRLKQGETVEPEAYDECSIYFSDIVGFTTLSASSTPLQVVDLLNDLYTLFDGILDGFDVYKVETIGDAYMVVSGLPIRNGNLHAREIARTSLMLLEGIKRFRIRHRPTEQLRLRIGNHSGPAVAGVVGLKMPRYCLFGVTVTIANKMESMGEALKIHISDDNKLILDGFGTFDVTLRGELDVKGIGPMVTWWLNSENVEEPPPLDEVPPSGSQTTVEATLEHPE
ncbi:atrial natriuretic peptide receptor 1-like [Paramacrobiotus metropolitanus]|uniref:atrial natriuretic peptide receptor 1-like n=1 Tax=Paramacrobiotus metropolitanus TaxID=2943436 RepID=UPI0024460065|nr:atrial natriuretic peptide receptor 1-like [Paramacrobiotus metropolitanus]